MKQFEFKEYRLSASKHCFVSVCGFLPAHLTKKYGRERLCGLKVFDDVEVETLEDLKSVKWGDDPKEGEPRNNTKLWEATQIQNIASWYGLAPRIYGLETVKISKKLRPTQVIEFLNHDTSEGVDEKGAIAVYDKVIALGQKYGFGIGKRDVAPSDIVQGKLIDFQSFAFTKDYLETVRQIMFEEGKYGKVYYQNEPELGLSGGPRDSMERIKYLGLDQIDFSGKVVWDVGCAGGFFTRYAIDRGAKRVIGFDTEQTVLAARNASNYLGYFNADYVGIDLSQGIPDEYLKPDIVFYLSMNFHIPTPQRIFEADTIIFEDNGKETRALETPSEEFTNGRNFKFIGRGIDHGDKAIYHLTK